VAGSRVFTINTTEPDAPPGPSCFASGAGNESTPAGYAIIDKTDDSNAYVGVNGELVITQAADGLSGTFTITPVAGFFDYLIAFKSGEGQLDPDFAIFALNGALSGTWTISGQQGLSHATLYARACPTAGCPDPQDPPAAVPLPAPVFMFLATLLSLGVYGWWRRRATV